MVVRSALIVFSLLLAIACLVVPNISDGRTKSVLRNHTASKTQSHQKWVVFKNTLYRKVGEPINRNVVRRISRGAYAFGRFINEARRKSLRTITNALPIVGEPTVICEKMSCSFCTFASVPSFDFEKDVCMEFSLRPKDIGLSVKLSVDGSVFTEYQVSWRKPSDVKLDLGGISSVYFRTRLYNNHIYNKTVYTCGSLEMDFPYNSLLYIEMGCYYMGAGGAGRWTDDMITNDVELHNNTKNHTAVVNKDNNHKHEKSNTHEKSVENQKHKVVETGNRRWENEKEAENLTSAKVIGILTTLPPIVENYENSSTVLTESFATNDTVPDTALKTNINENSTNVKEELSNVIPVNQETTEENSVFTSENTIPYGDATEASGNTTEKYHTVTGNITKRNVYNTTNNINRRNVNDEYNKRDDVEEEVIQKLEKAIDSLNSTEDEEMYANIDDYDEETDEIQEMKARFVNLMFRISHVMSEEEWDDLLAKYDDI